ncbi:MAG: DUF4399 domain-containing protein [Anaerolineae bacterium]|nr:DUF4399 domain-containing protein [Anaerolineae bacterium]
MTEDTKQLPAPEGSGGDDWLLPILVFFGGFVLILLLMLSNGSTTAPDNLTVADKQTTAAGNAGMTLSLPPKIEFVEPQDGQEVPTTFTVSFAALNLVVEAAGEVHPGAGHFHLLIDEPFVEAGQIIPKDATHLHFGTGALSAEVTLEPGPHTLRLQFADGAHTALEGAGYRAEITVTVTGS